MREATMVEFPFVDARVNVDDVSDPQRFSEIASAWFQAATGALFPEVWEQLMSGDEAWDTALSMIPFVGGPASSYDLTQQKWYDAVGILGNKPENVGFSAANKGGMSVSANIRYNHELGLRLGATVAAPAEHFVHTRWIDFLIRSLSGVNPAYGHAATAGSGPLHTDLDRALGRPFDESILQARSVLRGYAWVTVVPQDLVPSVGGLDGLRLSGAVEHAYPLARGGVLVQATSSPFDFNNDAMERLFRVLAPALPAGQPNRGYEPLHVVFTDASRVQRPRSDEINS